MDRIAGSLETTTDGGADIPGDPDELDLVTHAQPEYDDEEEEEGVGGGVYGEVHDTDLYEADDNDLLQNAHRDVFGDGDEPQLSERGLRTPRNVGLEPIHGEASTGANDEEDEEVVDFPHPPVIAHQVPASVPPLRIASSNPSPVPGPVLPPSPHVVEQKVPPAEIQQAETALTTDFVKVQADMMDETWPETPDEFMKKVSEDVDVIVEMFERLMGHTHGVRVPIADMMKMTGSQARMLVKNAISGEPNYEISTKANYMLVHTFAMMVRSYKEKTDKAGGIAHIPYFRRTPAPTKPGARRTKTKVVYETCAETDAESAWETAADTPPIPGPSKSVTPKAQNEVVTSLAPSPRRVPPPVKRQNPNGLEGGASTEKVYGAQHRLAHADDLKDKDSSRKDDKKRKKKKKRVVQEVTDDEGWIPEPPKEDTEEGGCEIQ